MNEAHQRTAVVPELVRRVQAAGRLNRDALASRKIAGLASRVAMLSSRQNVLFAIPAAFMLWGTQWAAAIEAWRANAGADIPLWLDVIGEPLSFVNVPSAASLR